MTEPTATIEHADLRALLPHRHPILLVDRVLAHRRGVDIETEKAVSGCEPCYSDLPEDAPVAAFRYPEVLLLESFVQSAGVLWLSSMDSEVTGTLMLADVRGARFAAAALPGDVVRHNVVLDTASPALAVLSGHSTTTRGSTVLTVDRLVLTMSRNTRE